MKERLKQILPQVIQASKDRVAALIANLKTPKGRKKGIIVLVCIALIGLSFLGVSILQKRQASYAVNILNTALKKKDLRGLLRQFDMPSVMTGFIQELVPLQAHFVYNTRAHKPIDEKEFLEKGNALLLEVALATFKPSEGPEKKDSKTPQIENPLVEPYIPFSMPTLIPLDIMNILAESSFTLDGQDEDIATVSIQFTHPALDITIPLKFQINRSLTSWTITSMSNAGLMLKQVAEAVQGQKNAAITAFQDGNKQVEELFELHFKVLNCEIMAAQEGHPDDLTIFISAEVANNGQLSTRATSLSLALFTQKGYFIGSLPADFAKDLPPKSKSTQSWRRTVKSARENFPLLFTSKKLRCTIKPSRMLFEDGQSITFLPDRLLNGL